MRLHGVVPLRLELLVGACINADPALRPAISDIISELRAIVQTLKPLVDCNGCITTPEAQAAVASLPLSFRHATADLDAQLMQDVQAMHHEVVSFRCHRLSLQEQVDRVQAADAAAESEARAMSVPGDGLANALEQVIDNNALADQCGADGMDCALPVACLPEAAHHAHDAGAGASCAQRDGAEVMGTADPSVGIRERDDALHPTHGHSNAAIGAGLLGSNEQGVGSYGAAGGEGNVADPTQCLSRQMQGGRPSHARMPATRAIYEPPLTVSSFACYRVSRRCLELVSASASSGRINLDTACVVRPLAARGC